ncbi:LSU ribosomal protein L5p (L11e) [Chondromyces apiculatus DSM 436]|uniref:Large ribosomal subunit protein uL5 n=1 Tax=Chondromyces apiculatus DSM 436 TaxID=1192034 RepID=A0A017TDM2_9BACT|nr:LSU ribosomal protein L5p (L11e) [Chondromyces apiculatus DSM 436]
MADKKDKASKDAKGDAKAKDKAKAQPQQQAKASQGKSQGGGRAKDKDVARSKNPDFESTGEPTELPEGYIPRLRTHYQKAVAPALMKRFGYKNVMMVPRLQKVVLNMGLGAAVQNPKVIDSAVEDMRAVSGQKPVVTRARKSIATFKLRENLPIGVMVTLRAERMWEFVDRLIAFSLPRVRDFKGVSPKGFDGKGNFTMGLREQIIFPEIDYDKIDVVKGMNISFVTSARTDEEGRALLTELGIPFRH